MNRTSRTITGQALGLLASFCFATVVCHVSNNLHARVVHRDETVSQQRALLTRAPLTFDGQRSDVPEFRNRILFPLGMVTLTRLTGFSDGEAFLATRWMSAFACFAVVWVFAAVAGTSVAQALLAQGLLAVFFTVSFNHPWEHPTDFPDAIVMVCAVWAALRRRFTAALATAAIGAANRESAAFTGVIWIFLTALTEDRRFARAIGEGVLLIGAAAAVTITLRRVLGLTGSRMVNSVAENPVLPMLANAFTHPFMSWMMLLVAGCLPVILAIACYWGSGSAAGRRLGLAATCIGVITLVIGSPEEVRILTPAITIGICALLLLLPKESPAATRDALPADDKRALLGYLKSL